MRENINYADETLVIKSLQKPYFLYTSNRLTDRATVAKLVFLKKENEMLLVDPFGFLIDSVFAGLTEKHIGYIAKNGPKEYKENLLEILSDQGAMKGVFEIAKAMDEDMNGDTNQNQERVKNVIQYIKDNKTAFEF